MCKQQQKDRHRQDAFVCLFLFYFSYLLFRVRQSLPEKPFFDLAQFKGNQGINIAFSRNGLIKYNGTNRENQPCEKPVPVEKCR